MRSSIARLGGFILLGLLVGLVCQAQPPKPVGEVRLLQGHTDRVLSVAFSADGQKAVSCGQDKTIRLWSVASGKELCRLEGHTALVRSVVMSADGSRVLSGSYDGTLKLWDVSSERLLQ